MATTGSSSSASTPDAEQAAAGLVIGIPAAAAGGAAALVQQVQAALRERADVSHWRIVVAGPAEGAAESAPAGDAGARIDVTYALHPSDALEVPYHGLPGRARAVRAILRESRASGAAGCIVVDPRTTGSLAWLDGFVEALAGGVDFVGPVYGRHPFTGALVHGIVSPMFRALYGARLRNPIGAHFACSARLADATIEDAIWDSDAGQLGIDLWLSSAAASGGMRLGQASVSSVPDTERPLDLSTTLAQVVGVLFLDLERRARVWQRVRGAQTVAQFGAPLAVPQPPQVDAGALADTFRSAHRDLHDVWAEVLPPLAILQWRRLAVTPLDTFRVDDVLWARTLYDFAMGYRLRVIARDHLLRSLTPMYVAWLASFIQETRHAPVPVAEARLDRLGQVFEREKPYLLSQWRWPERFKPVKLRR